MDTPIGDTGSAKPTAALPYAIVGVTALASVLLYLDRVCISFTEVYVREDLGINSVRMGWILGAFFFSYALAQVPSGWLSDRFGPRIMLTIYILAWSLFTALTGLTIGFVTLLAVRLAFGVAQAGAYPTSAVILGRWISPAGRGQASSVVALGGRLGGAAAPLLTAVLLTALAPAESARLVPGDLLDSDKLLGQLSPEGDAPQAQLGRRLRARLPVRFFFEDEPTQLREGLNDALAATGLTDGLDWSEVSLSREARALLAIPPESRTPGETERLNRLVLETAFPGTIRQIQGRAWREVMWLYGLMGLGVAAVFWLVVPKTPVASRQGIPWRVLMTNRSMCLSGMMQFGINIGWVFLITLLPRYLVEAYRVPIEERGLMAMAPLLAGCVGMLLGGRLTDVLTVSLGRRWGRALPIGLTQFVCALACLACPLLSGAWSVVAALAVMAVMVDLGVPAIWAFVQDVGGRHTGSALGWGNMWGNLGAAVSPVLLSQVQLLGGWTAVFVTCAVFFALAATAGLFIDASRPLEEDESPTRQRG